MKITRKNIERLFQNCKYNPERIGIALLRMEGYKVSTYIYSGAVYVKKDKKNGESKILYCHD